MTTTSDFGDRLKRYWEDPKTVSIIDKNLRELEIRAVLGHLERTDELVEIGCGDGQAPVRYAAKVRRCIAIDRSKRSRR